MPETGLEMESQTGQQITVNRFQLLARIGQVFLVETTSQIEDNRLNYLRTHQGRLLSQDDDDVEDDANPAAEDVPDGNENGGGADGENEQHGIGHGLDIDDEGNQAPEGQSTRQFLPSSFTGSVRHLKKLASNALALVSADRKSTRLNSSH